MTALKEVPSLPGYFCDQQGRVFSTRVPGSWKIPVRPYPRELRTRLNRKTDGYTVVTVRNGNRNLTRYVHRLMLEAWVGSADGRHCNHKNGIKTDNRIENLEWVSISANHLHRVHVLKKHAPIVHMTGIKNGSAKLGEAAVREVRKLAKSGMSQRELGIRFGVSQSNVSMIVSGKTWGHID